MGEFPSTPARPPRQSAVEGCGMLCDLSPAIKNWDRSVIFCINIFTAATKSRVLCAFRNGKRLSRVFCMCSKENLFIPLRISLSDCYFLLCENWATTGSSFVSPAFKCVSSQIRLIYISTESYFLLLSLPHSQLKSKHISFISEA